MTRRVEISYSQSECVQELLADGAGNKQIARRLGKSGDTVKQHLSCAMRAAGVQSRTELVIAVLNDEIQFVTKGEA